MRSLFVFGHGAILLFSMSSRSIAMLEGNIFARASRPRRVLHAAAFLLLTCGCDNAQPEISTIGIKELLRYESIGLYPFDVAISPDNAYLAIAAYDVRLLDIETREETVISPTNQNEWNPLNVEFSPDGSIVAWSKDRYLECYDIKEKSRLDSSLTFDHMIRTLSFAPDSKRVAVGSDYGALCLWDVVAGVITRRFRGAPYKISSVVFSPDGEELYSCGADSAVHGWDVHTGTEIFGFSPNLSYCLDLGLTRDGNFLLSSHENLGIIMWNLEKREESQRYRASHWVMAKSIQEVAVSSVSDLAAFGRNDGLIVFWDVKNWKELGRIQAFSDRVNSLDRVTCLEFSNDGTMLAAGSWTQEVLVWDVSGLNAKAGME